MMKLKVYRVRPDGSRVVIRRTYKTNGEDPPSKVWPPCSCPRCSKRRS